jgi:hypothetical protein
MNQYKKHFDELGQLRSGDYMPWTKADKVILGIFVVTIIFLMSGAV